MSTSSEKCNSDNDDFIEEEIKSEVSSDDDIGILRQRIRKLFWRLSEIEPELRNSICTWIAEKCNEFKDVEEGNEDLFTNLYLEEFETEFNQEPDNLISDMVNEEDI